MKPVRIYDICRELSRPYDFIRSKLDLMGVGYESHSSSIPYLDYTRLKDALLAVPTPSTEPQQPTTLTGGSPFRTSQSIETTRNYVDVVVIPDSHSTPHSRNDRYDWANTYIHGLIDDPFMNVKAVIELGDIISFDALCFYNSPRAQENLRLAHEIEQAKDAIARLSAGGITSRVPCYAVRGNHDNRLDRFTDKNPAFIGMFSDDFLNQAKLGWQVVPFQTQLHLKLRPACDSSDYKVDYDLLVQHYFTSFGKSMVGGGAVHPANTLLNKHNTSSASMIQGHSHIYDQKIKRDQLGKCRLAMIAGVYNEHPEDYAKLDNGHWFSGLTRVRFHANGTITTHMVGIADVKEYYDYKNNGKAQTL